MMEECKLSPLSVAEKKEINSFLSTTFPSLKVPGRELLLKWLKQDKKNSNGQINFTLLTSIGSCLIDNQFEVDELLAFKHANKVIKGTIQLPASKSLSNRALMIQALSQDAFTINNISKAKDTQILQESLNSSSSEINVNDAGT